MIYTNQLLAIAFTMISNFTHVVHLPQQIAPRGMEDVGNLVVGTPYRPLDLYIVGTNGHQFWIEHGCVQGYQSPESYFHLQTLGGAAKLVGSPSLTSNDVVRLALRLVHDLSKTADPTLGLVPRVKTTRRPDVPFYWIDWSSGVGLDQGPVTMEIDARSGRLASLQLWDHRFFDDAMAGEISNRVYRLTPTVPRPPIPQFPLPKLTDGEITRLLPKWLEFCARLNLDPGDETNLADVDWNQTYEGPLEERFLSGTLRKIVFRNDTCFECINETVFAHFAGDAAFVGAWEQKPTKYWAKLVGKPSFTWQEMARRLNKFLVEKLGVSSEQLGKYTPVPDTLGKGGVTRCSVRWCETKSIGKIPLDNARSALLVEFDLATGKIEAIRFDDLELLKWRKPTGSGSAEVR